jgi:hypothetical protein
VSLSQAEFYIIGLFMHSIHSETKKLRAIESNGQLVSLNSFMENKEHTGRWQDAPEYLAGLEVISEEAVKYHLLLNGLAVSALSQQVQGELKSLVESKTLDEKEAAEQSAARIQQALADLGYVLDYSNLGQFPDLLTKDKYDELSKGKLSMCARWRGQAAVSSFAFCGGGSWASAKIRHSSDSLDRDLLCSLKCTYMCLLYAVGAIEVLGFFLAERSVSSADEAGEQTNCTDTLIHHLAGPDCNYSCVLIDPEPLNASYLNASLLNVSSI